jgi:hypothetical protein
MHHPGSESKEAAAMPSMKGYHALKNLPEEKVTDKISRRILAGDQEMIVWSARADLLGAEGKDGVSSGQRHAGLRPG